MERILQLTCRVLRGQLTVQRWAVLLAGLGYNRAADNTYALIAREALGVYLHPHAIMVLWLSFSRWMYEESMAARHRGLQLEDDLTAMRTISPKIR